ncbi:MAG: SNF2-related protein, partial [Ignavibacteria bacterium]|nr:SNF2-related protein [Ignavibacteria bacterium]
MNQAQLKKDRVIISFLYDPALVLAVKTLSGRWWHSDDKYWSADLNVQNIEKLVELNFSLSSELQEWYACMTAPQPELPTDITIPGLRKALYLFQKQGVAFMELKKGRVLLADSMGLGKTMQTLAWLQLHKKDALPAVVICPCSLKLNWQKEISIWTNLSSVVWSGRNGKSTENTKAVVHIINYDILAKVTKDEETGRKNVDVRSDILALKVKTVIIDEAHFAKDSRSQRAKAVLALCKTAKHVIALTGTPIVNRPVEIYNSLKAVAPQLFPSFIKFAFRYCAPHNNGFGWNFKGASNTKELHELLTSTVMLRRTKEDVLKELPPKVRSIVPLEINNRKEY